MNRYRLVGFYIIFFLALLPLAFAADVPTIYEKAAVGRIVGDSPDAMKAQLKMEELDLKHVSSYDISTESSVIYDDLLDKIFKGGYNDWETDGTIFPHFFDTSELIIVNSPAWNSGIGNFYNDKSISEQYNPLEILNHYLGGLYLPERGINEGYLPINTKADTIVIGPTSTRSDNFIKALLCNIALYSTTNEDIGIAFRMARNRYYWGTSAENYEAIGLVLLSYTLYGSPLVKTKTPYTLDDFENEYRQPMMTPYYLSMRQFLQYEFCGPYMTELKTQSGIETLNRVTYKNEFSIQGTLTNIYTKEITYEIEDYNIVQEGNFSLLYIVNTNQRRGYDELVTPQTVIPTEFPLRTAITNISLLYLEDPVDITISKIPMWQNEFVERTCYENTQETGIEYTHSFTEDSEVVLVTINPVEVLNCETGQLRLYKTIKYKIDYLPYSPILFEYVNYPDDALPEQQVTVFAGLRNIKTEPQSGTLIIRNSADEIVSQKDITLNTETDEFALKLTTPKEEGIENYKIEFVQDNDVKTYVEFPIRIHLLDARLIIPELVSDNVIVQLELYNRRSSTLDVQIKHYLKKGDNILQSDSLVKTLSPGWNVVEIPYSNLKREDQSYDVIVDLLYEGRTQTLSGSVVTNHAPVLEYIADITVEEGKKVTIEPEASDLDHDYLTYTISDPVGNDGLWYPGYDEAGNYTITVSVSDGLLQDSQTLNIEMNDAYDSQEVIFRDCGYGVYRGDAEIATDSDFDDILESWTFLQFSELNNHFAFKTIEGWPVGTCGYYNDYVCVDDSNVDDPDWYSGRDKFPDPVFTQGGDCDTGSLPNALYKNHEVCEGSIACEYPTCTFNSECGTDSWIGSVYCSNGSVYQDFRNYSCNNAGSYESECLYIDTPAIREECTSTQVCYNSDCVDVECFNNEDCGADGYLEAPYCNKEEVYQDYISWTCSDAGTAFASCLSSSRKDRLQTCNAPDQTCLYGICLDKEIYVAGGFSDNSTIKELIYTISGDKTLYIKIPKNAEVRNTNMKVDGGP